MQQCRHLCGRSIDGLLLHTANLRDAAPHVAVHTALHGHQLHRRVVYTEQVWWGQQGKTGGQGERGRGEGGGKEGGEGRGEVGGNVFT